MIVSTCSTNSLDSGYISRRGLYKVYAITYHVVVEWGNAAGIPFSFGVHNGIVYKKTTRRFKHCKFYSFVPQVKGCNWVGMMDCMSSKTWLPVQWLV